MRSSLTTQIATPEPRLPAPLWIHDVPPRQFPYGPRDLYFYLCGFESGTCHLTNSRLAHKFHVSKRTLQHWKSWLAKNHLIRTWTFNSIHPRITAHSYPTFLDWQDARLRAESPEIPGVTPTPPQHSA